MAILYPFKCTAGHVFDVTRPAGQESAAARCPDCGEPARRIYQLRGLGQGARPTGSRP